MSIISTPSTHPVQSVNREFWSLRKPKVTRSMRGFDSTLFDR